MTDKIVVLSTCASQEEAEKLARILVETAGEYLLLIKSSRGRFEALRAALEKAHSYEVPEVIALPVVDGAPNYLNWIDANL